jgi:hypothetical protein
VALPCGGLVRPAAAAAVWTAKQVPAVLAWDEPQDFKEDCVKEGKSSNYFPEHFDYIAAHAKRPLHQRVAKRRKYRRFNGQ